MSAVIILSLTEVHFRPSAPLLGDDSFDELKVLIAQNLALAGDAFHKIGVAIVAAKNLMALALGGPHDFRDVVLVQDDILYGPKPSPFELWLAVFRLFEQLLDDADPLFAFVGIHGYVVADTETSAQIVHGLEQVELQLGVVASRRDQHWFSGDDFWSGVWVLGERPLAVYHIDCGL